MRGISSVCIILASLLNGLRAAEQGQTAGFSANPIRKVVTMLQSLQKKITEEGEKEKELYDKFMCYCKANRASLTASIEASQEKLPQEEPDIQEAQEQKSQLKGELTEAQDTKADDRTDIKQATSLRGRHHHNYEDTKRDYKADITALDTAITALEKGNQAGLLQTSAGSQLKKLLVDGSTPTLDEDRDEIMAFLEGREDSGYAPPSSQILGILKQIREELLKNLVDARGVDVQEEHSFQDLESAKSREIKVLGGKILTTLGRIGELGVDIQQMKDDVEDTQSALSADQKFLRTLEAACSTKTKEFESRKKTRTEELVAIGDTIKLLNDDDALDLFKKTLPSAAASLMQVQESASVVRARALAVVKETLGKKGPMRVQAGLIALALSGKKAGFDQVLSMIDGMVEALKAEQTDDAKKKKYCETELDDADDQKKSLNRALSDAKTAMEKTKDGVATLKEELATLTTGIKELDKSVTEATEQRKKEHQEYTDLMAENSAAKELLDFAKDRLSKFYHKRETEAGTAAPAPAPSFLDNAVLAEVAVHRQPGDGYSKKSEEVGGVVEMINVLIHDLTKELSEAKGAEKQAQSLYETMMADSTDKRSEDSKLMTQKEKALADMEAELEGHKDAERSATKELLATAKYLSNLHGECDWLIKYFDQREQARDGEIDSIKKARAVLAGADYSLLQTARHGLLRGPAV